MLPERSEHDDVYADLPPDLVALLHDPRITLPGELQALEPVHRWATTTVNSGPGVYLGGPVSSDTPGSDTP
jgi:hypothetical protein